jgi:hypothetical protein
MRGTVEAAEAGRRKQPLSRDQLLKRRSEENP